MGWFAQGVFGICDFQFWWSVTNQITWWSLLAYATVAGWTDVRSRTIPNWLTSAAFVAVMGIHVFTGAGLPAVAGFFVTGMFFLMPTILKVWGQGDWKMAMVYGAGLGALPTVFLWSLSMLVAKVGNHPISIWSRKFMTNSKAASMPLGLFVLCGTAVAYLAVSLCTAFR